VSAAELAALGRSLERLALDLLDALRDGVVSVDELVRLGCDVPAVIQAAADLAHPDDLTRAERAKAARIMRRAGRRALLRARHGDEAPPSPGEPAGS
jgi:hypothetical protein